MSVKFASIYVGPILDQNKTQTLRYDWDKPLTKGDIVKAVDAGTDTVFCDIKITNIEKLTIQDCVDREFEGHENYESVEELVTVLNQFYTADFDENTTLHLIEFETQEDL